MDGARARRHYHAGKNGNDEPGDDSARLAQVDPADDASRRLPSGALRPAFVGDLERRNGGKRARRSDEKAAGHVTREMPGEEHDRFRDSEREERARDRNDSAPSRRRDKHRRKRKRHRSSGVPAWVRRRSELRVSEEVVRALVVESHLEGLPNDIRTTQQDDHSDRAPHVAAVQREGGEQDGPQGERSRIGKPRDPERDVVEPRSLKTEKALDRPAISPFRRWKPIGDDEHDDKTCPTQSREEK